MKTNTVVTKKPSEIQFRFGRVGHWQMWLQEITPYLKDGRAVAVPITRNNQAIGIRQAARSLGLSISVREDKDGQFWVLPKTNKPKP